MVENKRIACKLAQAGLELTAILGVFLIIILFYAVAASGVFSHMNVQGNYNDAYVSAKALASAADSVYAQGNGAATTVQINLPSNTRLNATYIGRRPSSPTLSQNTISINVDGTDVYAITRAPLSGEFPGATGEHVLRVVSHGSYVSISSYLLEVSPPSLLVKMRKNSSKQAIVYAKAASASGAAVNATLSWQDSHSNATVSTPYFIASSESAFPLTLNFSADAAAGGQYSSQLQLTAFDSTGAEREAISMPVTLEIQES